MNNQIARCANCKIIMPFDEGLYLTRSIYGHPKLVCEVCLFFGEQDYKQEPPPFSEWEDDTDDDDFENF